ncbi:glioma pathogenesis-related protein 1-like [Ostrea edulis]|uniref:glioma pathogenesis-related protein 1-like n=1 Tax=Ostrea edulis TaxID=37623 RepID=UPI0024AFC11E|nr:glioma pathogenesis-related protein 1-like [Ostrea edulis]
MHFLFVILLITFVESCQCESLLVITWANDTSPNNFPRDVPRESIGNWKFNARKLDRQQSASPAWISRRNQTSRTAGSHISRKNVYPSNWSGVRTSTGQKRNDGSFFPGRWNLRNISVPREDTRQKAPSNTASSKFTNAQKRQIVQLHNEIRKSVIPRASNMKKMRWDNTLEHLAQQFAETCSGTHNAKRHKQKWADFRNVGENIHHTWDWVAEYKNGVLVQKTLPLNISKVLHRWWGEKDKYDYEKPHSCSTGCGHYIQMVKDVSYAVGCGTSFCREVKGRNYKNAHIFVCNYGDGYNESLEPYAEGPPCSDCPTGRPVCNQGLCDAP